MVTSSNSIILFSLIYPSPLGPWPEDEGCSWNFLLLSCIVLISFLPRPCLRGDTQAFVLNLGFAHIPVSVCWLQPFSNHSRAAGVPVHCLAGAVSPVGTSSSKANWRVPPSTLRSTAVAATMALPGVSSHLPTVTDGTRFSQEKPSSPVNSSSLPPNP